MYANWFIILFTISEIFQSCATTHLHNENLLSLCTRFEQNYISTQLWSRLKRIYTNCLINVNFRSLNLITT